MNYSGKPNIVLKGKCSLGVTHQNTRSGISLAKWGLEVGKLCEQWICVAWREVADKARDKIVAGTVYVVTGKQDDLEARTLTVSHFNVDGVKEGITNRQRLVMEYGTKENYQALTAAEEKRWEELGYIKIIIPGLNETVPQWRPKTDCVFRDNRWQSRMEWVMDVLGGQYVSDVLREEHVMHGTTIKMEKYRKVMEHLENLAVLKSEVTV